jgi:hypothetical protein
MEFLHKGKNILPKQARQHKQSIRFLCVFKSLHMRTYFEDEATIDKLHDTDKVYLDDDHIDELPKEQNRYDRLHPESSHAPPLMDENVAPNRKKQ